jgi:Uncharacterised protein family (UPF0160)
MSSSSANNKRPKIEATNTAAAMTDCSVTISVPEGWQVLSEAPTDSSPSALIGTHSGTFHCDEALACGMLKTLPQWRDAAIVRTRDPEQLAKCDIVVDVGGTYDPATRRLDHHQKTFTDTMAELGFNTRLSSAGLVYRHYGLEFIKEVLAGSGVPDDVIENVMYKKVRAESCTSSNLRRQTESPSQPQPPAPHPVTAGAATSQARDVAAMQL